jgi:uncharacterized protein (DUF433 family)
MERRERKSAPFSIRLGAREDSFVKDEARRLRRSRGAVVEAYTAEAIRMRRFPGIAFRGGDRRRRAWVLGTGLDVWEVVGLLHDFGDEAKLVDDYGLTPGQIRVALAYHREYGDEIDEELERGRRPQHELELRYPFIESLDATAGGGG